MTDQMWDRYIRDALLETTAEEFAEIINDTTPVQISRRYRREMERMLRDPAAWVRRKSHPRRTMVLKVAAFALVCGILFSCALAASPSVRAKVVQWAREVYETMVVYRFSGEPTEEELPRYVIGDLPEGYVGPSDIVKNDEHFGVVYQNKIGEKIHLLYHKTGQGSIFHVKTEGMEIKNVQVGKYTGQMYLSINGETSNGVIWMDEEKELYFAVDGFLDESDLLHMAESVILEDSTK